MFNNLFYKKYAFNIHSQNGEDGIVKELLRRLNIDNGLVHRMVYIYQILSI